jgi:hypothetical protein
MEFSDSYKSEVTTGSRVYSAKTTINGCSEQSVLVFIDSYVPIGNVPCTFGIDDHIKKMKFYYSQIP